MAVKRVTATLRGNTYELYLNDTTGKYEANIPAPDVTSYGNNSGNYFPITLKVEDDAGNVTTISDNDSEFGDNLRLFVKEKTAPTIVITRPAEDEVTGIGEFEISFKVTDTGSGIAKPSVGVTVDDTHFNMTYLEMSQIANGYSCTLKTVPLQEGTHTIIIKASDNDGNVTTKAVNFKVDSTPPELVVTSPINNLITNNPVCVVSGRTNDSNGISGVTIKTDSGTFSPILESGEFSQEVILKSGTNLIVVTSTDLTGQASTVTRVVDLISEPPAITDVQLIPNTVNAGQVFMISATAE